MPTFRVNDRKISFKIALNQRERLICYSRTTVAGSPGGSGTYVELDNVPGALVHLVPALLQHLLELKQVRHSSDIPIVAEYNVQN